MIESLTDGEEIALSIIANINFMLGLVGLLMLIVSPLYIVKIWKNRDNPAKPVILIVFGIGFVTQWIYGRTL